ncbi:MAG: hypothetical protein M1831_003571 [Alyxoria varia]|nr:MAG: hypothetical protein M1831_003571 [Alyxoria varia]
MAGKLDQSLEDIVKANRQTSRRVGGRRVGKPKATGVKPTGIKKANQTGKAAAANAKTPRPAVPTPGTKESKIMVTGMPPDVGESQIKEYFAKTIGPVKRVILTYGPNGQSRGVCTIVFMKPSSAVEAANQLNGVAVDTKPMKIEVIVGADQAPVPVPPKALGERIAYDTRLYRAQINGLTAQSQPVKTNAAKGQNKPAAKGGRASNRGRGNRQRGGRSGARPKPKTTEELDTEMADYFGDGTGEAMNRANGNAVAQQANVGGDTGMDDEIQVSLMQYLPPSLLLILKSYSEWRGEAQGAFLIAEGLLNCHEPFNVSRNWI